MRCMAHPWTAHTHARLSPGEPLLLVFGGASVNDMLINWARHVTKLELPFVVACMDDALFALSDREGLPAVTLRVAGGEQPRVQTQWKYYRMDPKAFLTMGLLKVRFFMEFLRGGFEHSWWHTVLIYGTRMDAGTGG